MDKIEQAIKFLDSKRKGYNMLKDAIEMVALKQGKVSLYKEVFPKIAKKYSQTPQSVERDIRYLLKKGKCPLSSKKFILDVVKSVK